MRQKWPKSLREWGETSSWHSAWQEKKNTSNSIIGGGGLPFICTSNPLPEPCLPKDLCWGWLQGSLAKPSLLFGTSHWLKWIRKTVNLAILDQTLRSHWEFLPPKILSQSGPCGHFLNQQRSYFRIFQRSPFRDFWVEDCPVWKTKQICACPLELLIRRLPVNNLLVKQWRCFTNMAKGSFTFAVFLLGYLLNAECAGWLILKLTHHLCFFWRDKGPIPIMR